MTGVSWPVYVGAVAAFLVFPIRHPLLALSWLYYKATGR